MKNHFLHFITIFVFVLLTKQSLAQNRAWILAPNYIPNTTNPSFQEPLPTALFGYDGSPAQYSQNIQLDKDGNILFFIVDSRVYDRNGKVIEGTDGSDFLDELDSYQRVSSSSDFSDRVVMTGARSEVLIIPDKKDCNLFHLFSTGYTQYFSPMNVYASYGRIRISYMANGELTPSSGFILHEQSAAYGPYVATMRSMEDIIPAGDFNAGQDNHHRSPSFAVIDEGNSYTVFFKNFSRVFRLTIDNSGIHYNNYTILSSGGQVVDQATDRYELEAVKLSNGNYRLASFYRDLPSVGIWGVFVCDLTPSGTIVSGSEKALSYTHSLFSNPNAQNFTGLEFNPDGSRIFVSHLPYNGANGATLDYWDISGTPVKTEISNDSEIGIGQIERAKDGNLYIPKNTRLARISNINTTPTVNLNAVTISTYPGATPPLHSTIRLLQEQIDNSTVYNDVEPSFFHVSAFDVTANAIWNGGTNTIASGHSVIHVEKELRIKAGVVLTIQNMVFKFAPGARLVVENGTGGSKGGRLQLNNTTLTNYEVCGEEDMWLGVEVWGNTTVAQGASYVNSTQGVLRMFNNSRIEHAMVGVLVSKRNEVNGVPSHSYNYNHNGGIAIIENSHFFNCREGMSFLPYNIGTSNLSRISSSNFVWDGLLKNPWINPYGHITINQCTDIVVNRTDFYQHTPNLYSNPIDRGYGIFAFNSTVKVFSGCSAILPIGHDCPDANNLPSKFENLYSGVIVWNLNNKPFVVLRNEFTNCIYGITSTSAEEQIISRNKLYIPEIAGNQTWGIHVTTGTGYQIAENYLKGIDNPSVSLADARTYGIIIDNSGEAHNEVYKNTFEELYVGTQAQNNNAKIFVPGANDNAGGLQYICNEFKHPIHLADIGVNGRIDYEQGRIGGGTIQEARNENTARNKFSLFGESHSLHPDHDIMLYPGSQQIDYVHLADNAHTPDNYTINPPTSVYPVVQTWGGLPLYENSATCPTLYPAVIPIFLDSIIFFGMFNQIDSLNNIFDGGNTDKLLNLIASQPASTNTHNELMNASPYLSDKVLKSYIQSTAPDYQLKSVLAANSGLSVYIRNVLNNSKRSAVKRDLALYQNQVSAGQKLLSQIRSANERLYDKQRTVISAILSDTTITATSDSLVKYLEQFRGTGFKKTLLSQYSNRQEQEKFNTLLENLSGELTEQETELYKIQYTINGYVSMQEALEQHPDLIEQLQHISQSKAESDVIKAAQSLILALKDEEIVFDVLPLQASKKSIQAMTIEENSKDVKTEALSSIEFFPNPSTGVVQFRFSELESDFASVQFLDITGKEVFSRQFSNTTTEKINVSHLKKGTYMVNVVVDGVKAKAQLLVLE